MMAATRKTAKPRSSVVLRGITVDNPYFSRAHPISATNPERSNAVINIRESAITTLYARGKINDAQKEVADRFRSLWETLGGKGASSIDPAREHVDGGKMPEPISERQIMAAAQLANARVELGARGFWLVSRICGEGCSLAEALGTKRKRDALTAADNLRACLDDLAELWHLKTRR
jgi:hypothetical protein